MSAGNDLVPRATYRLQLRKEFGFADAEKLAPYLSKLGISHLYLSPILKARPGSTHGYDTVDHAEINPELGGIAGFRRMAAAFRAVGIGIVLDIVPNHMGIGGSDNPYWLDVLENGEASRYARWFDIDWAPAEPSLAGKLLVPFLDRPLGAAIEDGLIELRFDSERNAYAAWVHGYHRLPIAPETYGDAAQVAAGGGGLAALLARQHWRLASASTGDDIINYRRFFIISDLAGIRIEDDEVFVQAHRLIFALIEEGLVDGLRVDHIDGLYDPAVYCRKLRERSPRPIYVIVEKILGEGETLPADWGVDGTTGYEFAALVTPLLVDPQGETALTEFHRHFTGMTETPAELERAAKLRVLDHELAAELEALSWRLVRLAAAERPLGDLTRHGLKRALRSVLASMPVYRTYLGRDGLSAADREVLDGAFAEARRRSPELEPRALDFLEAVMTGSMASPAARDIALRLQQFAGPVMAKGLEDTALYRYSRLVALNDVGERPDRFSRSIAEFHAVNLERARSAPDSMLGSTTHDSKRGEDTRCRIATLSGHAQAWTAAVPQWSAMLRRQGAPAIHPDDAYMIFQLLLGAWPTTFVGELDAAPMAAFAERLCGAMQKSLREARLRSHWTAPDADYEAAVAAFIQTALDPAPGNAMLASFRSFEAEIAREGALNGLIETVLKLTLPGVPDFYQGAELWEQSLVDPDNRRPVDFNLRQHLLAEAEKPIDLLLANWRSGAVKQALIARLLQVRRDHPALFSRGSYTPIVATGPGADQVCAFERRLGEEALVVAVQLYPWRHDADCRLELPAGRQGWTDLLTGKRLEGATARFADALPLLVRGSFQNVAGTARPI